MGNRSTDGLPSRPDRHRYFTEYLHGVVNGKSGVDPSLCEDSGGPAPGSLRPGAGSAVATPSIPSCQEPPSAACYAARVLCDLVSRSIRGGGC